MDTKTLSGFFDELEKVAQFPENSFGPNEPQEKITKERLKRLLQYGAAGALGWGLGHGIGNLVGGQAIKMIPRMSDPTLQKIIQYGAPISAALGTAHLMMRKKLTNELMEKVKGNDES